MAQTGDYDQYQGDSSLNEDTGEKTSLFGKLKNRTKDQGRKLKTRLQSPKGGDTDMGDEEETTTPTGASDDNSSFTEPESQDDYTPAEGKTEEDSGLSKQFEGLSTNENTGGSENTPMGSGGAESESKPVTETVGENVTAAKDTATEKMFGAPESDQKYSSPDVQSATDQAGDQAGRAADKATEAGKTWSQWAAEKVGYAKDTAAAKAPTTEDGTPVHEKAFDAATGYKDQALEQATGAKDQVASQIPAKEDIPSDPAQQTYFQKATGGFYGAKDSLFSNTQPQDHDKALSQKVTESVGNLPASLKSSLGFGGKTASSPTTTPGIGSDAPAVSSSEEAADAPPQSPGLVSRITGLFGAAKKPEDSSPTSESTVSETGPETQTEVSEGSKPE